MMYIGWALPIALSSLFGMRSQAPLERRDGDFQPPDVLFEALLPEIEPHSLGGMRREDERMRHSPGFGWYSPLFAHHCLLCA